MNCGDFLAQFREALEGKVPEPVIQENMDFYNSYIKGQTGNGKSEGEVLAMLGDPRLLAKSIAESSKFGAEESRTRYTKEDHFYNDNTTQTSRDNSASSKQYKVPGWLAACILIVVLFLLLFLAFRAFVFFMPVIIMLMAVGFIYHLVRDWISS